MGSRRRSLFVILFVVGLTLASIAAIASQPTRLGLDLRGGTELVYQGRPTPQNPEVEPEDIDRAIEIIRDRTDALGVAEPEIARVGADQVSVGLPDVQNAERAIEQVGTTAQLFFYDWEPNVIPNPDAPESVDPAEAGFNRLIDAVRFAAEQEPECFRDQCTTSGPRFYLFNEDTFELLAGPEQTREDLYVDEPDRKQPEGSIVIAVPQGTVVVEEVPSDDPETDEDESATGPSEFFVLRDRPALSGKDITNPEQQFDPQTNQPNVTFDFTDEGRQAFQQVTREIAQRGLEQKLPGQPGAAVADHFAIVLDQEVVTRPIIDPDENPDGIDGRTGAQISGSFTITEAQDLAEFLRIGALPIELKLISQSTVSATLGQEALDQGLFAGIAGLIMVLLFLIAYYRLLGIIAGLGLLVYATFFYALIELIPITLTLPGIAGLILTIGVAADSNIVIFERIKEEARAGRSMTSAIATGYRKGIATIIDANVITLITAFILFVLATAGVKGFAFTLGVGTVVSLFTAVVFTQAVLATTGRARFMRSPRLLGAGEQRVRWNFDFAGMSRWFFSMSGVILAIGAVGLATKQLNLGIDFESGTRIRASLEEPASVEQVRSVLADAGVPDAADAEIQQVEEPEFGENVFQIQTSELQPEDVGTVQEALVDEFGLTAGEGGAEDGFQNTSIGPTFGEQVTRSAVYAVIFSLILISAYVAIRFQPKFAVPVIIAVIHDLLITAGIYSLIGAEVSSATVAALLTILGYSLYDTVIVFDRIRENMPRMPRATFSQIVNRSLSEVLTRSLITGLSTGFVVLMLLLFGGETLQAFATALLIGLISGAYSSIFIASPVLIAWKEREPQYRARRAAIEQAMGYVPVFPEDNRIERLDDMGAAVPAGVAVAAEPAEARSGESPRPAAISGPTGGDGTEPEVGDGKAAAPAGDARPAGGRGDGDPATAADGRAGDELVEADGGASKARRQKSERRKRQQRRRRKHGRHR